MQLINVFSSGRAVRWRLSVAIVLPIKNSFLCVDPSRRRQLLCRVAAMSDGIGRRTQALCRTRLDWRCVQRGAFPRQLPICCCRDESSVASHPATIR